MTLTCECSSLDCFEQFESTIEQLVWLRQNPRIVLISKTCRRGPELTDVLVDEGATFWAYEEAE